PNISGVADAHADVLGSQLVVRADLIDLTRSVSLGCSSSPTCAASGFDEARFVSSGDIRLADHGADGAKTLAPGLFSDGALAFAAAQVYVASRLQTGSDSLERADSDPGVLV